MPLSLGSAANVAQTEGILDNKGMNHFSN
jgi:hypothetical protein